jgi:hypothetical protein
MPKEHKAASKKSLIKRNRNGREHINNCATGYCTTHQYCQIHHIVCVSSMADGTIAKYVKSKDKRKVIRECLKLTDWNINAGHNVIGLPLKRAYVYKLAPSDWGGLPCHQVEHNPAYTEGVSDRLHEEIWQPIAENAEDCEFEASSLVSQLKDESKHWRSFLVRRGKSKGGTGVCWKNRKKLRAVWYIPFSMNPGTPVGREPPPDPEDFSGSMKQFVKEMFAAIV